MEPGRKVQMFYLAQCDFICSSTFSSFKKQWKNLFLTARVCTVEEFFIMLRNNLENVSLQHSFWWFQYEEHQGNLKSKQVCLIWRRWRIVILRLRYIIFFTDDINRRQKYPNLERIKKRYIIRRNREKFLNLPPHS